MSWIRVEKILILFVNLILDMLCDAEIVVHHPYL